MRDFCGNCEKYIEQIELKEYSFGCPICKRDDNIITFYYGDEIENDIH